MPPELRCYDGRLVFPQARPPEPMSLPLETERSPARSTSRRALGLRQRARADRPAARLFGGAAAGAVGRDAARVDGRPRRRLGTIGLLSLAGLPYTIKFLWAPVVDALPRAVAVGAARAAARLAGRLAAGC